jgi:hypothetical protein
MTRPLTKRELVLAARPLMAAGIDHQTRRHDPILQFMIINACRGIAIGITFAVALLMTDAFGIYTLILAQASPMMTALIFVFFSSLKFVGLTIAVSAGLLAYSE